MKERRWTAWEVAAATNNSYDSVCGYMNRRGMSVKDGMTISLIIDYLKTDKRDRRPIDQVAVSDLKLALSVIGLS